MSELECQSWKFRLPYVNNEIWLLWAEMCTPRQNSHVEILALSTSEYDFIWRYGL